MTPDDRAKSGKDSYMKKKLLSGVFVAALGALVGLHSTGVSAEAESQVWSVFVHFEYADGTSYDYPLGKSVSSDEMRSILQDCGRSHRTGSVVRYYCYPVAE
jgi:hypothetical protein